MNINKLTNATISSLIANCKSRIVSVKIYAKQSGEDMSETIVGIEDHIKYLEKLYTTDENSDLKA